MPQLSTVQPGDLITSQLMNDIINALNALEAQLNQLDAEVKKCCEEIDKRPTERAKVFIDHVEPAKAAFGETVTIVGGGFVPHESKNSVAIGKEPVTKFGKVTESSIEVVVPLEVKKAATVRVVVKNDDGDAEGKMTVVPLDGPRVPFVPTPPKVVEAMLEMAKVTKRDFVIDLGCGDGRVVIRAAQPNYFAKGLGIDNDPDRVKEAITAVKAAGLEKMVTIEEGDLLTADLAKATVVTLHLTQEMNLLLRPRLEKLDAGTRIVSHAFDMGDWKPDQHQTVDGRDIYFWVVPKR